MKPASIIKIVAAGMFVFACLATTGHAGSGTGLVDQVVNALGVTNEQATGGLGAIFQLAKNELGGDFSQVADSVPNMDALLAAAPKVEKGARTSTFGSAIGDLGNMAKLAESFSALGMDVGMVSKFIPMVLDYVGGTGGETVKNLMVSVLL